MEKAKTTTRVPEVISFCKEHDFNAELVGKWVWITFDEKPDSYLRKTLKDFGFRWSKRRGKWAHNCGHPTKSAYQSSPWDKYHRHVISGPNANS